MAQRFPFSIFGAGRSGAGSAATDTSGRPSASGLKPGTSASLFNVTAGGGAVETVTVDAQGKASFTTVKQPGQSYVIDGTARLDAGPGQVVAPAAPTMTLTAGNGQVSIAWTDGANGGSAITSHGLYRGTASGNLQLVGFITSGSPYVDAGLTNGTAYIYQLSAKNGAGESVRSAEATATPAAAPAVVTVTGTPQVGQVLTASESSNWSVGGVARSFLAASTTYSPVPQDTGKTITATGATSGTTSAPTAAVTDAPTPAASPTLATGARGAMLGDSITQFNVDAVTDGASSRAIGEMSQAVALDQRMNVVNWYDAAITGRLTNGSCQGIAGQTSTQIAARVNDVVARNPQFCVLAMGTNNAAQVSTVLADITSCRNTLRNAGIAVIIGTIRPNTPANEAAVPSRSKANIQACNAQIRSYVAGLNDPLTILWDAYAQMDRGDGYGDPLDFYDGQLHPNARGAELSAWGNDPSNPSPYSLIAAIRKLVQPGSLYTGIISGTNLLPNPIFATATGGTLGTGITGTVPASWRVEPIGTPGTTAAVSTVANAATGGNSVRIAFTAGGTAAYERIRLLPASFNINSTALAGLWGRIFAEIETDAAAWLGCPNINLQELDSGAGKQVSFGLRPDQNTPIMSRGVPRRRLIMSEPMLFGAATTQLGTAFTFPLAPSLVTPGTQAVALVHRVWAGVVANPKPDWNA